MDLGLVNLKLLHSYLDCNIHSTMWLDYLCMLISHETYLPYVLNPRGTLTN